MDDIDIANERAEAELTNRIAEHSYKLAHAVSAYPEGECRNCGEKLDDRPYCDEHCRDDHWERIKLEQRNRKYRGG